MTRKEKIQEVKKLNAEQKEVYDFWVAQGVTFARALTAAKSC